MDIFILSVWNVATRTITIRKLFHYIIINRYLVLYDTFLNAIIWYSNEIIVNFFPCKFKRKEDNSTSHHTTKSDIQYPVTLRQYFRILFLKSFPVRNIRLSAVTELWIEINDDLNETRQDTDVISAQRGTSHFSRHMTEYLNEQFPDRWIGRGGPQYWPLRSPDLTPLDFHPWAALGLTPRIGPTRAFSPEDRSTASSWNAVVLF
jgi:hypothetical protein